MNKTFYNAILIILILFIGNCDTATKPTTPNESIILQLQALNLKPNSTQKQIHKPIPISAEVQKYIIQLYNLNADLAFEVGRLPEFQNEVSPRTEKALKRFVNLVSKASDDEISKFKAVIDEGIPEVRKFCVPLQATFWLLEREELYEGSELLNWSLDRIIYESWNFSDPHWKGKGFDEVSDRLNSPTIIAHCVRSNFHYSSKLVNPYSAADAIGIFERKIGWCNAYADFQCHCLNKAGYDAKKNSCKKP